MLGTLPKLADKAFVLGFLLPAFLFLISILALVSDLKTTKELADKLVQKDALETLALFVLLVWGLAILMMMLNHTQYRMLEGYLWPLSKVKWLKTRQLAKFEKLTARIEVLADKWESLSDEDRRQHNWLRRHLVTSPTDKRFVLPTRFGNSIRAFEFYSNEVYGADSIPLWLRLATVIPKEYQTALEDARAQVNCLVNLCYFAMMIEMLAAIRFVESFDWRSWELRTLFATQQLAFLMAIAGAVVVAWVAYELSIERVRWWGGLVNVAFDCYLPSLAKKLGYKLPPNGKTQREFWEAVSRRAIYHRELEPSEWPRADATDNGGGKRINNEKNDENESHDAGDGSEEDD